MKNVEKVHIDYKNKEIDKDIFESLKNADEEDVRVLLAAMLLEKCSDDGEPGGTAGKPILNVLQKRGKNDCLVAVVRYFGGIKLGAGGLVRAYGKAANDALENEGE